MKKTTDCFLSGPTGIMQIKKPENVYGKNMMTTTITNLSFASDLGRQL